jgi:hypothetical protein
MKKVVIAVCVFVASAASAADVDWKFYGSGGYVPPITRFIDFAFDQMMTVVLYEQIADIGLLEPTALIYWELGCSEKMIRVLDLSARNGIRGSVRDWKYVAPETNSDRLLKMLCGQ